MSKVLLSDLEAPSSGNKSNTSKLLGFFKLNSGEETLMRIVVSSVEDLLAHGAHTHNVSVGGKFRDVNCLRTATEPLEQCPLCESGSVVNTKFFIPVIQYAQDVSGNVVATPLIWTTSSKKVVRDVKNFVQAYGDLSNIICKVSRSGAGMQTRWDIVPLPNAYDDAVYVKDITPFENFKFMGTLVLDKNFEEMSQFMMTGDFPQSDTKSQDGVYTAPVEPQIPPVVNAFANTQAVQPQVGFQPQPEEVPYFSAQGQQVAQVVRPTAQF